MAKTKKYPITYELRIVYRAIGPGQTLVAQADSVVKSETYEGIIGATRRAQADCLEQVRVLAEEPKKEEAAA